MNIYAKAGIAVAVATGGLIGAHHLARAADPVPVAAKADGITIPAKIEAHVRAMAQAHAPAGQADLAEAHVMAVLHEHLAEAARDPVAAAHIRQVLAAADAGDQDAMRMVHEHLMALAEDLHH